MRAHGFLAGFATFELVSCITLAFLLSYGVGTGFAGAVRQPFSCIGVMLKRVRVLYCLKRVKPVCAADTQRPQTGSQSKGMHVVQTWVPKDAWTSFVADAGLQSRTVASI